MPVSAVTAPCKLALQPSHRQMYCHRRIPSPGSRQRCRKHGTGSAPSTARLSDRMPQVLGKFGSDTQTIGCFPIQDPATQSRFGYKRFHRCTSPRRPWLDLRTCPVAGIAHTGFHDIGLVGHMHAVHRRCTRLPHKHHSRCRLPRRARCPRPPSSRLSTVPVAGIALPIVALIPAGQGLPMPRASASHANVIARASASVVARRSVSLRGFVCTGLFLGHTFQPNGHWSCASQTTPALFKLQFEQAIVVDCVSIVAFFAPTNANPIVWLALAVPPMGAQVGPVEIDGIVPHHLLLPRSRRTYAGCCPRQLARASRTLTVNAPFLAPARSCGSDTSMVPIPGWQSQVVGQANARGFQRR